MTRLIRVALAGTMLIVIWSAANISWSGSHASGIIKADGRGYYAHLPALFIYHDLNFGHFDSIEAGKYNNPNYNYDYRKYSEGYTLNKYFAGTSLAMLPFFGLGHALTLITGEDADGYSNYYQIAISLAGITYLFLSLLVLIRIAREFHISDKAIALAIPIIVLGTNWYYYVVSEPAMSHVYSVFFISTFVYQSIRWSRGEKTALIWMGILLGLITFIRPVNAIIVFIIPVLFKNISDFSAHLLNAFKHPGQLMAAIGLAVLIPMLQLVVYKIQTGHFFIYAYEEEGF
ncbi:MAG: hypothetical protein KDC76_14440, partial [Bacteroidetes bacterium]|nr:hypothetical protein [Bacteroidota bacterium]